MNILAISITQQAGGLNFSLKPVVRHTLHELYPQANILPSLFIAHTAQQPVKGLIERLAQHIVPALTGLTPAQLAQLSQIVFVDTNNGAHLGEYIPRNVAA